VVSTFSHYLANKVSNKRKGLLIADFRYKAATSCSVFAKSSTSLSYTVVVPIEYAWGIGIPMKISVKDNPITLCTFLIVVILSNVFQSFALEFNNDEIPDPRTYEKVVTMTLDVIDGEYVNRRQYAREYNRCFGPSYDVEEIEESFTDLLSEIYFPVDVSSESKVILDEQATFKFQIPITDYGVRLSKNEYTLEQISKPNGKEEIVILVHGLDSNAEMIRNGLEALLVSNGYVIYIYNYPNDGSIIDSAESFGRLLKTNIIDRYQNPVIHIIAHSMGGLVSRVMLEYPPFDSGTVETLIMLATPNKGSYIAELRPIVEFAEILSDIFSNAKNDGFGEAGSQLLPHSAFMSWNALLKRNPRVSYYLLLGTQGIFSSAEWDAKTEEALSRIRAQGQELSVARKSASRNKLDEVQIGKGDGVVAILRGSLDGCMTKQVKRTHLSILEIEENSEVWTFIAGALKD